MQAVVDGVVISGKVSGSFSEAYRQTVKLAPKGGCTRLDGDCSCPMRHHCKHVVVLLLAALDSMKGTVPALPYSPGRAGTAAARAAATDPRSAA
jgi:uncharacterized Zn finger protein